MSEADEWRIPARLASSARWREMVHRLKLKSQYLLVAALFNVFLCRGKKRLPPGSFAYAGETMDRGWNILLFPEGEHTQDG